jgi:type VI secretion system Hcp family effector
MITKFLSISFAAGALCMMPAMAENLMKLGKIEGTSEQEGYSEYLSINEMNVSYSNSIESASKSTERSAATPRFGTMSITRRVDESSPELRVILMRGESIPTAKFVYLVNFGREMKERYSVELSNVVIKSIEVNFSDGDEPAEEVIQLGFNQAKWTYSDNDDSGKVEKHSEQFSTLTGK